MKASEARKISKENRINEKELDKVFSKIRESAMKGECRSYFTDLSHSTKDELKKMGYMVTSFFSMNESADTVSWYEVDLK